ncbi:MAG: hypothetical protein ACR2FO_07025 [Actinomycetota bacterium]
MPVNRPTLIRAGVALGVMGLVVGGIFAGRTVLKPQKKVAPPKQQADVKGFTTVFDRRTGIRVSYPKTWENFERTDADPQVPLIAGPSGGAVFVQIRVCSYPQEIARDAVPALGEGFSAIVKTDKTDVAEQKQVVVAGLPGWYYLYRFYDEGVKQEGVHSHYFLIDKAKLVQLVLEVRPTSDFKKFADTFDKIANSFKSTTATGPIPPCAQ